MSPNAALRNAIFLSGQTQRAIAMAARIHETHLSAIIHGRSAATKQEQKRLAHTLGVPIATIFPEAEPDDAVSSVPDHARP